MHGPVTADFLEETATFCFQFCCETCSTFDENTEQCTHGYPNDMHRAEYFEGDEAVGRVLVFCREFDLE